MEGKKYFAFVLAYFKQNLSTAMEYRVNFITQFFFMVLNDFFFILFWYFLFKKIDNINGWGFESSVLLFAFAGLSYGFLDFFFGNWRELNKIIAEGSLDFHLALPKNELLHTMISKSNFSGMGDIVFGVCLFFLFGNMTMVSMGVLIIVTATGTLVLFSTNLIFQSMAFYVGNAQGLSSAGMNFLTGFSVYPISIFDSTWRFIFYFVFPIAFITNVPVILLQSFSLFWLVASIFASTSIFLVSLFIYKKGLKKYESGNLLNIRV